LSRTFYPEISFMPAGGVYRPLFRLFSDENWRMVRKDGKPVERNTAGEARQAARDCLEAILNPPLRSETMAETETADILGIAEWHETRAARAAEEQQAAFGTVSVKGRVIEVERRRARI